MNRIDEVNIIEYRIIDFLKTIQSSDGSFDTYYLQPYFHKEKKWMKFPNNAPIDTAVVILSLFENINQNTINIVEKGINFIKKKSLDEKLWSYAPLSSEYLLFYDSESTSLCSYVLEKKGFIVKNKYFLDSFINSSDYYIFIVPKKISKNFSFFTQAKLFFHNRKVFKCKSILNNDMSPFDYEFSTTCNNLIYIGETSKNKHIWEQLKSDLIDKNIRKVYYPTIYQSLYCYSRLFHYSGNQKLKLTENQIDSITIELIELNKNNEMMNMNSLLLVNSLLMLGDNIDKYKLIVNEVFNNLKEEEFKKCYPLYSSNINTDVQPDTNLPNTYFGSPAITCSLYLEFLNLYRKKLTGNYYGEK